MVVKTQGEFTWHSHPDTDDFFIFLKGKLTTKLREGDVLLNEGELNVILAGVDHCPVAEEEVHLLLMEPKGTPNTGDEDSAVTKVEI